jgi:hypothetical protein
MKGIQTRTISKQIGLAIVLSVGVGALDDPHEHKQFIVGTGVPDCPLHEKSLAPQGFF